MDLSHTWGEDLELGLTGDLASVTGSAETKQRLLRRYFAALGDDLNHPQYGAGIPGMIGQTVNVPYITGVIRSQTLLEQGVQQNPAPTIQVVSTALGYIYCTVNYTDANLQEAQDLNFQYTTGG